MIKDQSGFSLIIVLWVLVLLIVVAGNFSYITKSELQATGNFKRSVEALYIAEAGAVRAVYELVHPTKATPRKTEYEYKKWRVDAPIEPVNFGNGSYSVRIDNNSGKFNLNTIDASGILIMLHNFKLDDDQRAVIIDSILDWRDSDDQHRLYGAEDEYYLSLSTPYFCKNGQFDTVNELLHVRGITPSLFYGGLQKMATVSFDPAVRRQEYLSLKNRININAAPRCVLLALTGIDEAIVDEIVKYRRKKNFLTFEEVSDVIGEKPFSSISSIIGLTMSPEFSILSEGRFENSSVKQRVKLKVRIDPLLPHGYKILRRLNNF